MCVKLSFHRKYYESHFKYQSVLYKPTSIYQSVQGLTSVVTKFLIFFSADIRYSTNWYTALPKSVTGPKLKILAVIIYLLFNH